MVQVLVVDDDPDIRMVLSLLLAEADHTVSLAQDGPEALQLLRTSRGGCVVLLDIKMPVMDGWAALRIVQQEDQLTRRHAFVVITAGQRTFPLVQARLLAEWRMPIPVLPKPFDIVDLHTVVNQAAQSLGRPPSADENRSSEQAGCPGAR